MQNQNYQQQIDEFGSHYQYDVSYMRELLEHTPQAYVKFDHFLPLVSHREYLDKESFWLVKLLTMQAEDCADCLQLNVRMAIEDNISRRFIQNLLKGSVELEGKHKALYAFITKQLSNQIPETDLENQINSLYTQAMRLEISLAIATAKVFPTIKKSLGYTKSCQLIHIDVLLDEL